MKDFFAKNYKKFDIPILLICGMLTALPLVFTSLGFLQWVSVIPVAWILIRSVEDGEVKLGKFYLKGLVFFMGYYVVSFHWFFYMYPLDFAGVSKFVSLIIVMLGCFGISLVQALQSALVFLIFGAISRVDQVKKHSVVMPFIAAALWTVFECWQTVGWWGVPWGRLPLGQIGVPILVRSASLFGSYFITFVIIAVNFCFALAIVKKGIRKVAFVVAISLFALNLALGTAVTLLYKEEGEKITVAATQGNFASGEKWDASSRNNIVRTYASLTIKAAEEGAEVIVWPETALPYVLFEDDELKAFVSDLAVYCDATLIISVFTRDEATGRNRNSMIEVRNDGTYGEVIYSKQRLVPFGEFVPMRDIVTFFFPPLADINMLASDLVAGEESVVIDSDYGKIGCGVCFDSIYEKVIYDSVRNGAQIIAISTNDSWFSDSAALDMHNSQSRLRAIENGRYVVRSANTGITSVIDPLGNVLCDLGAGERDYVTADVYMREQNTLYTHIGNAFVYLCIVFIASLYTVTVIFKFKNIKIVKKD